MIDPQKAWEVLRQADLVCGEAQATAAVERLASEITSRLQTSIPLVLCVMGGGVVLTGQLLPRLRFPLELDYIHVTRYAGDTRGGDLQWRVAQCMEVQHYQHAQCAVGECEGPVVTGHHQVLADFRRETLESVHGGGSKMCTDH